MLRATNSRLEEPLYPNVAWLKDSSAATWYVVTDDAWVRLSDPINKILPSVNTPYVKLQDALLVMWELQLLLLAFKVWNED